MVALRGSGSMESSPTADTVTVRGVRQSVVVKVSDAGVAVAADGAELATSIVTGPVGPLSSATVQSTRASLSPGVAGSSASARVTGPPWTPVAAGSVSTVTAGASVLVTVTVTSTAGAAS